MQSIASSAASPDSRLATPPQLQSPFKTLALMILVALLLRLVVMIFLLPDQLDPARDHWKFGYETGRIARSIVTGKGFSSPLFADTGPTAWMTPIYPYVVAAVFKVFGIYTTTSAVVLLTLNALLSALTCIPIFLFAAKSFGPTTGIWSGWTWVFFPYAIYFPVERIWETWLATLLFAFLFLMALNLSEGRSLKLWGAYGLLWGIAALTSPSVLAVLPFLGGWIAYRLWRSRKPWFTRNLLAGLIFVAVVSPWFVRNYRVFHRLVPFRDNMGMVLRLGTKGKTSYWGTYDLGPWHNDTEWQEFQKLGELGYMEKEEHQAFLAIRANPGWYLWTSFRRAVFIWTGYWSLDREYLAQEPFDPYNIPLCTALTVLALIGLRRAFQEHVSFGLPYALVLLTFPLIYYFTSPEVYYRRPLDPMILVLAIFAIAGRKQLSDISAPVLCAELLESQEPRSIPAEHLERQLHWGAWIMGRVSQFFLRSITLVLLTALPWFVSAQSPNPNQSQAHSGSDEGKNGPKSPTPQNPAQTTTNPENPDATSGKVQTLTGVVSDSFCGPKHYQLSGATPAECTRYCIAHRGTYALVVGSKVYELQNRPGHTLDALAGQRAKVTGAVNGSVVQIQSISPIAGQGSSSER